MNTRGFALLELFAVIALLSLVAAIAVPQIIEASSNDKKNNFNKAIEEVFTESLSRLNENIKLSKSSGSWNCKDFKYKDDYAFSKCIIVWDDKNPTINDIKITVTSSKNDNWKYISKTKQEIENNKNKFD